MALLDSDKRQTAAGSPGRVTCLALVPLAFAGAHPTVDPPGTSSPIDEEAPATSEPGILLPESLAARAWAGADAGTSPAEIPTTLLELGEDAWRSPACWSLWGELIQAERAAPRRDARRRASLCLLARRQDRNLDAWAHFATLTASPEWAAATLPFLMPGIPVDAKVEAGGRPAPLPSGVILRPIPPPASDPKQLFQPRTAEVHGLRIGAGEISMIVRFESSGIEIEILHTGGESVDVSVVLPEPEGLEMNIEYTNWVREDDVGMPRALTIGPGDESLSVYGRFGIKDAIVPTGKVDRIPDTLARDGLFLDGPAGSETDATLTAAAATLSTLLELPVRVRNADGPSSQDGPSGTVVHLGDEATQRLSYLAGRVEEFLLETDPK